MRSIPALALAAFLFVSAVPALAQSSGTKPTCAAGDPVVWVNTSSKVYHMQGDQYYGNTKHGNYACKSAAEAAGNHLSGQKSSSSSSKSSKASPAPHASASPAASSKHHHHKASKSSASPAPAAT